LQFVRAHIIRGDRDSSLCSELRNPFVPFVVKLYREAVAELNAGAGYVGSFSRVRFAR